MVLCHVNTSPCGHSPGQQRRRSILLRKQLLDAGKPLQRPSDGQLRIVRANRALAGFAPVAASLVKHLRLFTQGEEAVDKAHRHPALAMTAPTAQRTSLP